MEDLHYCLLLLFLLFASFSSLQALPWRTQEDNLNNFEGSSDLVNLQYHMGPVLASPINLYIIWYGHWNPNHQDVIRDFIFSLSPSPPPRYPSVAHWWQTVRLYTDQTNSNITGTVHLSDEFHDSSYSQGSYLSRLAIQHIIKNSITPSNPRAYNNLPLNPYSGFYLVLTSPDVQVQDFCRAVCGFHYFTFPMIVGATVPYAWVGHSGEQCPGVCAYPFARPTGSEAPPPSTIMGAPNGYVGADGMVSVIAHELAEASSNPLVNAWYAGEDPTAPTEIADLCVGLYGSGGGGGYVGNVYKDNWGNGYNLNGVKGRKFMVQWVWNPVQRRCFGPNALD
ncbi:protein EXORDIUM-like 7 [Momordica charantia]|uniref:Protein EXORDIUM-like 7 n=1 Tax=Momordica charantia TaxID=3673 RepID=A0A6J1CM90_MOMCH|nr:protein EXORDIUM-like 7 [Momordica charantia]